MDGCLHRKTRLLDPITMGVTEVVMPNKKSDFDEIDFVKALSDGIKNELARFPELMGDPERFRRPGEYVAPVRTRPVEIVSLSVEEFIELSRNRGHGHR